MKRTIQVDIIVTTLTNMQLPPTEIVLIPRWMDNQNKYYSIKWKNIHSFYMQDNGNKDATRKIEPSLIYKSPNTSNNVWHQTSDIRAGSNNTLFKLETPGKMHHYECGMVIWRLGKGTSDNSVRSLQTSTTLTCATTNSLKWTFALTNHGKLATCT